jgi:hypothetical protein
MKSTGSHSGVNVLGLIFNWDGSGTGGGAVGLRCSNLTPGSNGIITAEAPAGSAALTDFPNTFSLDQWYELSLRISGVTVDAYLDGVYKASWSGMSYDATLVYLALFAYNCDALFRNVSSYHTALP